MAYYGDDGRLTIDEVAANSDINKIRSARAILEDAKASLNTLLSTATMYQGNTALSIQEKAQELLQKIDRLNSNLVDTESYIQSVVNKYQMIDLELKALMNQ